MLHRLRNWLWSIGDAVVFDQRREIYSLRSQLAAAQQARDESERSRQNLKGVRDSLLRLIDAILKGIGLDAEQVNAEWKSTPATAMHAVGAHVDQLRQVEVRRAEAAESSANDLRTEIRDLQRSLETEQRAHEKTRHEKTCTEAENRLLAAIHETDVKRREAERAIEVRREVEAEAASDMLRGEDRE